MTKDYSKAIDMGTSIITREPNDYHVRKCLSALRKLNKRVKSSEIKDTNSSNDETAISSSDTEESEDAGSTTDEDVDEIDHRIIDATASISNVQNNVPRSQSSKSIADCVKKAISASTGSTNANLLNFREKMYRVLPLKFYGKKSNE